MKAKARAVVRSVAKHRVFFLIVMGLFTVGLLAGSYAVQQNAGFSGQTQAGDHDWWQGFKGDNGFCANCHTGIGTDLTNGPHGKIDSQTQTYPKSECSYCHTPGNADHAAASAACTDCHTNQADELNSPTEAHNGIMASLQEGSPTDGLTASQTCQACHTHAAVDMTVIADAKIPLQIGGP